MKLGRVSTAAAIIAAVSAVAAFRVLLLRPRVGEVPEVWLSRIVQMEAEAQDLWKADKGPHNPLLTGFEMETWRAEFTIAGPPGSGIVLTNGPIGIKLLSSNGVWTAAEEFPAPSASTWRYVFLMTSRKIKVRIPAETRSCRFTVGYRLPTSRERCNRVLVNLGLWRRLPGFANWAAKWFSNTEIWLEDQLEIDPFGSPVFKEKGVPAQRELRRIVNPEPALGKWDASAQGRCRLGCVQHASIADG